LKVNRDKNPITIDNKIDKFVEEWYEKNKESIDIGEIEIAGFKFDLMPDNLEMYIYKKCLKICFAFMMNVVE